MKARIVRNWYRLAPFVGALFGLMLELGSWDARTKMLLAGAMFIHLHFYEEFGSPGGFPWQGMRVEMHATECRPEEWDLTELSAFFGNEWFALAVYVLPLALNVPFLTLAAAIFAFAELFMHLVVFNVACKQLYNPGLASVLIGLVPTSLAYLIPVVGAGLFGPLDWVLAIAWIALNYWIAFRSPLYRKLGEDPAYKFTAAEARGHTW